MRDIIEHNDLAKWRDMDRFDSGFEFFSDNEFIQPELIKMKETIKVNMRLKNLVK